MKDLRAWIAGGSLAALLIVALPSTQEPAPLADGKLTRSEAIALLQQERTTASAAGSDRDLARLQNKVRAKAARRSHPGPENPGALIQAMADIKTARDGTTYQPGYKARAIQQAKPAVHKTSRAQWISRGPGNIPGRARAVVVDPSDATHQTWFAASIGGGIWKTTDRGATWVDKTPDLLTLSTTCLAIAPSNPDVIYAGTGMGYGRIVDLIGSGIWKSTDHGETWNQLASTADGSVLSAVNRIVVDPQDANVVVMCSNDGFSHLGPKGGERVSGIFRSVDGGNTWTQTFDPDAVLGTDTDNRVQQIVVTPGDFNVLYATVNEVGVVKSIDGGVTWGISSDSFALPADVGNPPAGGLGLAGISVRTEMAIAPSDVNRLYAAVERPRGVAELFMSTDAGATWNIVHDAGSDPNWFNAFGQSGAGGNYTAGWFNNTIAVHPYDPNVVFVGGVNLYRITVQPQNNTRSTESISWWFPVNPGPDFVHADHHWLQVVPMQSPDSFWLLGANDGGVAYTLDPTAPFVDWVSTAGMVTSQFYGADKKPGESVYIGGMQDNGTAISPFEPGPLSNWQHVIGGDGFEVAWNSEDPTLVMGGYQFGGIQRSTDGGASFAAVAAVTGNSPFITKIANGKTDPDLVFTIDVNGVNRSDDFGASWSLTPLPGRWLGYRPFDNVEIGIADPQVVWVTSRLSVDPATGQRGGIHVSTDGGLTFTDVSDNLPPAVDESSGIGTHPTDPGTAYLCFSAPGTPKVLRTVDYGATWTDLSGFSGPAKDSTNGFPDVAVFSVLVMPFDPDVIWAGTEAGLFVSSDAGATWGVDDSMPRVAIFELSIVDDQVIAATQGRGVLSATLPELAGYSPPFATRAPRLREPAMLPSGMLGVTVDLRSAYDKTVVRVDGTRVHTERDNPGPMTLQLEIPVTEVATVDVEVISDLDEREFRTPRRTVTVFPATPADEVALTFDEPGDSQQFVLGAFFVQAAPGFAGKAMHSPHPYPAGQDMTCMLKTPIRVRANQATLSFNEVVLVEEGVDPNFTDPNFWDYAIVEATLDGRTWVPLVPGYDSRADDDWLNAYRSGLDQNGDSNTVGDASLFRTREIDLRETFSPGDLIFVRFRLFSDPLAVAWGWVIEDLQIQATSVGIEPGDPEPEVDSPPAVVSLDQNHPNPFNPTTTIRFATPRRGPVSLVVYDARGRRVRSLVEESRPAGAYTVTWDGRDDRGQAVASGVYSYRLRAGQRVLARRMTLMK